MPSACLTRSIYACGSRGSIRNLFCPGLESLNGRTGNCEWRCGFASLVSAELSRGQEESKPGSECSGWSGYAPDCERSLPVRTASRSPQYKGLQHGYICWIDEPVELAQSHPSVSTGGMVFLEE